MSWVIAGLLVATAVMVWQFRVRSRPAAVEGVRQAAGASYHAVSIECAGAICAAARVIEQRRFLCAEAPRLPVPDCTESQCGCRYRHHADRRCKSRRADDPRAPDARFAGDERRCYRQGRRRDDVEPEAAHAPRPAAPAEVHSRFEQTGTTARLRALKPAAAEAAEPDLVSSEQARRPQLSVKR